MTNVKYVARAYVFFVAAVSAILTIKMFTNWNGEKTLYVSIALGLSIELGKVLCEFGAVKFWPQGLNNVTAFFVVMSVVFLGLSAMATQVCLSTMDDNLEKSTITSSVAYTTSSDQISILKSAIITRTKSINEARIFGDQKTVERLQKANDNDTNKIDDLSKGIRSIHSDSPTKRSIMILGLTPSGVNFVYWVIAIALELSRLAGLVLLNATGLTPENLSSNGRHLVERTYGDVPRSVEVRQARPEVRHDQEVRVATPTLKLLVNDSSEEECYQRAVQLIDDGHSTTHKALMKSIGCGSDMMTSVLKRLRDNGILRFVGNRHVRIG